jgi:hypothetical protein
MDAAELSSAVGLPRFAKGRTWDDVVSGEDRLGAPRCSGDRREENDECELEGTPVIGFMPDRFDLNDGNRRDAGFVPNRECDVNGLNIWLLPETLDD